MNNTEHMAALGRQLLAVIVDMTFLAVWVVVHWAFDVYVVGNFHVTGFHIYLLRGFQVLFAVTTSLPILYFSYLNIVSTHVETAKRVRIIRGGWL